MLPKHWTNFLSQSSSLLYMPLADIVFLHAIYKLVFEILRVFLCSFLEFLFVSLSLFLLKKNVESL